MTAQSEPSSDMGSRPEDNQASQFVGFRIAGQHYVFPIEKIQEIVILDNVTHTPQVADYVEGVSNLRGTIIPIINLRRLLGLALQPNDEETRTIVVNVGSRTMGCTVDAVTQVVRISHADIQPAPQPISSESTAWIAGFAKLNDSLHIVLDIDELLDPLKLEQVRQSALSHGTAFENSVVEEGS